MSDTIVLGSSATIVKPGTIKVASIFNPETTFIKMTHDYFADVGYSEMYPNFDSVNIGAVHPFALLMFEDVQGVPLNYNVFPSITVSDNSESEDSDVIGDESKDVVLDIDGYVWLQSMVSANKLFISDTNLTAIATAVADGGELPGVIRTLTFQHSMSFSIWTSNRDVTNIISDILLSFLVDRKTELKLEGVTMFTISGSRTGDFNMDFGKLLYGATVTVPVNTQKMTATFDSTIGIIGSVGVNLSVD